MNVSIAASSPTKLCSCMHEVRYQRVQSHIITLYAIGCLLVAFKAHWGPVNCNVALNYKSNDTLFALKSDFSMVHKVEKYD